MREGANDMIRANRHKRRRKISANSAPTRVSVIGLGRLGLPLAACLAYKGFSTIGLDIDSHKVQAIRQGIVPVYEPGLKQIINKCKNRLIVTEDYREAVMKSDVTFILVPTPTDDAGGFSLKYIRQAMAKVADAMREKTTYHLVVLRSTVMPGATENEVKSLLETRCLKRCGKEFGLCYNPEFVALGSVIRDLLNPDFILIGESDPYAGRKLAGLYTRLCENKPPVARMNFVNAELIKIALNSYVTTKITFANTLARICERLPGADVDVVTSALGLDSRIGQRYLKGAVGYGGPCFPRDNLALTTLARSLGTQASLAETTDYLNRQQVGLLAQVVKSYLPQGGKTGILGLAYKDNSDVVVESQGVLLAQMLANAGISVIVYDPAAMNDAKKILKESVTFAKSAKQCIGESDVIVVITPWKEFKQLSPQNFVRRNSPRVVIDCWRILDKKRYGKNSIYVPLGVAISK